MTRRHFITQGEHCVSADSNATISTILGSCVACCLWDPLAQVGGMNHILLATNAGNSSSALQISGVHAMELLINDLLKIGAARERLLAKVFGGAQMIAGLSNIGPANCDFALTYLRTEGIACKAQSLGGDKARQVIFFPTTGAVRVKTQQTRVVELMPTTPPDQGSDLELF